VQDVAISSDGQFALSGSWDSTLRLWDLNTGVSTSPHTPLRLRGGGRTKSAFKGQAWVDSHACPGAGSQ